MNKILALLSGLLISALVYAQGPPDSDDDGINDAEDECPYIKGSKARKGCPGEKTVKAEYIRKDAFENILAAVCNNNMQEKVGVKTVLNKAYITSLPNTGKNNNLPVYYKQASALNYHVMIGLSENIADSNDALRYVNELFKNVKGCDGLYNRVQLGYSQSSNTFTDVIANEAGGVFFYLEKAVTGRKAILQLRIYKINYADTQKKAGVKLPEPVKPVNVCADFESILEECINGYGRVKGNFVRQETPAKYYATTLPGLGLTSRYVVESVNIDFSSGEFNRKNVVYYNAEKDFTDGPGSVQEYEQLKQRLRNCFSGTANTMDEKNQKIYELFFNYKGYKIRAALLWLSFFGTKVSISFRIAD